MSLHWPASLKAYIIHGEQQNINFVFIAGPGLAVRSPGGPVQYRHELRLPPLGAGLGGSVQPLRQPCLPPTVAVQLVPEQRGARPGPAPRPAGRPDRPRTAPGEDGGSLGRGRGGGPGLPRPGGVLPPTGQELLATHALP